MSTAGALTSKWPSGGTNAPRHCKEKRYLQILNIESVFHSNPVPEHVAIKSVRDYRAIDDSDPRMDRRARARGLGASWAHPPSAPMYGGLRGGAQVQKRAITRSRPTDFVFTPPGPVVSTMNHLTLLDVRCGKQIVTI